MPKTHTQHLLETHTVRECELLGLFDPREGRAVPPFFSAERAAMLERGSADLSLDWVADGVEVRLDGVAWAGGFDTLEEAQEWAAWAMARLDEVGVRVVLSA